MKPLILPKDYKVTSKNHIERINSDLKALNPMWYLLRGNTGTGKSYLGRIIVSHVKSQIADLLKQATDKVDRLRDSKFDCEEQDKAVIEQSIIKGSDYISMLEKMQKSLVFESLSNYTDRYLQNATDWTWNIPCFLDDLGFEKKTEAGQRFVQALLERKYNEFMTLTSGELSLFIITTNLTDQSIERLYGEHILSRFNEMFTELKFTGEDFRKTKKMVIE